MGKPTGFLEYPRQGNPAEAPKERVRHFCEFHPGLGREERRRQGARCMECGVPFCQSGIPARWPWWREWATTAASI